MRSTQTEPRIYGVEAKPNPKFGPIKVGAVALIQGPHKLVRYFGYQGEDAYELYDLHNDPNEMKNRYEPGVGSLSSVPKEELVAKLNHENHLAS